jgi:DinB superfamily
MADDRGYVEENTRERERMRAIAEAASDDDLRLAVNPHWTVAAVLGHIAFWDARVLALSEKIERGASFGPDDHEPEDVDWINDASRPLIHAVPPLDLATLAMEIAEQADERVTTLPLDRLWPTDPNSPLQPLRASHRGEHLDEVEAALRSRD